MKESMGQDCSISAAGVLPPPKVSVVTVNYNMRQGLERTVASVLSQTYPNLEYLIIDGGSKDGSIDVIHRHAGDVAYWVSESDKSLYDAMNKGARAATGDWVLFMNSDDCFVNDQVIADIFSENHADADLVYGHARRRYEAYGLERVVRAERPSVLPWRMHCSHQSLFVRRELLLENPFADNISADYEFLLTAYSQKRRFKLVDRVISVVTQGGISDTQRLASLSERWKVLKDRGLITPLLAAGYAYLAVRALVGTYGKRILGRQVTTWILRSRRS